MFAFRRAGRMGFSPCCIFNRHRPPARGPVMADGYSRCPRPGGADRRSVAGHAQPDGALGQRLQFVGDLRHRLRSACGGFDKTPYAWTKAIEWSRRDAEYVKRAGFALMACLAVHDKTAPDERFEAFLPLIGEQAGDDRNFVKKAVNWALRQIGKRNPPSADLNERAIQTAHEVRALGTRSARWIAAEPPAAEQGPGRPQRARIKEPDQSKSKDQTAKCKNVKVIRRRRIPLF